MTTSAQRKHETRALLRAHLSAAVGYRHLTRRCRVCHRLLRLAMESAAEVEALLLTAPAQTQAAVPQVVKIDKKLGL